MHPQPLGTQLVNELWVWNLPENVLSRAEIPATTLQTQEKAAHRGRWEALQEPVTQPPSRCHRTLGPQLYIPSRQFCAAMIFGFALFSFPRSKTLLHVLAVLPTTLPLHCFSKGRESNKSNCFPLSPNRRQLWAYCAISKKKNSQQTVYLQLLLQTLSSSANHSTPKTKLESWESVHNSRVLRIIKGDILLLYSRQRIPGLHQIWETFPFILNKEVGPDPERSLPPTSHQNQHPVGPACSLGPSEPHAL